VRNSTKGPVGRKCDRMGKRRRDDDPMIDFQYTCLKDKSDIGLVVCILDRAIWLPVAECTWDDKIISMPKSLAKLHGLVSDGK